MRARRHLHAARTDAAWIEQRLVAPLAEERLGERQRDRMEEQGDEFSRRVRQGFLAEAAEDPQGIVVVNAAQTIEQVQADIRRAVQERLQRPTEP